MIFFIKNQLWRCNCKLHESSLWYANWRWQKCRPQDIWSASPCGIKIRKGCNAKKIKYHF